MSSKGTIAVLTGGGDVPGLNPAIRAITIRATRLGYRVLGIRRGWAGMIGIVPDREADNSKFVVELTEGVVNKTGRTGGTFLHTSRTRPSTVKKDEVPEHLRDRYTEDMNDLTPSVLKNIEFLGIDYLIPIGGDDTLSYAKRLHDEGVKCVAIPKTMDNDVPGTDYCIGFSTCVTRTIEQTHRLRTSAGSHERFLVIEVFGRYAGFTALIPTMAGAANRCIIPEHEVEMDQLMNLIIQDREADASNYAVLIVSEGAKLKGAGDMVFQDDATDAYGHKKLGGIGDQVAAGIKALYPKYRPGKHGNVISQRLAYLVRSGDPDAIDATVPMVFGNLAVDLILKGVSGRLVNLHRGVYGDCPVEVVTSYQKVVDVGRYYDTKQLRPSYDNFYGTPIFSMSDS